MPQSWLWNVAELALCFFAAMQVFTEVETLKDFSFFFPFSLEYCPTLGQNELYGPLGWPQMTLCFLTYCLFCHHNSTWLHLNKHVIYCTWRLESSEVICSHSEKTSFPYASCYTKRVVGFARVGDFPKGYRTKLCTLLFTNLKSF